MNSVNLHNTNLIQKSVVFYTLPTKREIKKSITFTTASKKKTNLRIDLTKE